VARVARKKAPSKTVWRWLRWLVLIPLSYLVLCLAGLVVFRFIQPPITMIQAQRLVEAVAGPPAFKFDRRTLPLSSISPQLQHAVVASEDARFYQHWGLDFEELKVVAKETLEDGDAPRGGSTITQQLVKNLFFTTHRNPLRKAAEFVLAPVAEVILNKQRILELYLNQVEWGPGIYGAEAASRYHYGHSASRMSRDEAIRMAAVLPAPRRYRPARMNKTAKIIETRMAQMGY
jgi:monofunctional biosynthetic peptidoglycan transglycosylase